MPQEEAPQTEGTPESSQAEQQQPQPEQPTTEPEISAQPPAPAEGRPKRGGCGLIAWIVILAVALAVAAYLVHRAQVEEERRRQAEKMQRKSVRASQLQHVGEELAKALEAAKAGDIGKALLILEAQSNILSSIATEAAASHDAEDANNALEKKRLVTQVANSIRQKQEEVKTFAASQISSLASAFPQIQEAAVEQPQPQAEKEKAEEAAPQPVEEQQPPAEGVQQPAKGP